MQIILIIWKDNQISLVINFDVNVFICGAEMDDICACIEVQRLCEANETLNFQGLVNLGKLGKEFVDDNVSNRLNELFKSISSAKF